MRYVYAYNILLFIAAFFFIPYYGMKIVLTGKYRRSIGPKLGFVPPGARRGMEGSPRIWVHAVSVGEVTAAAPIVSELRELFPHACIVVSTSTETGQEMAQRLITDATAFIYYPLDIPFVSRKVLRRVNPDVFVPVETEIWPNFIRICRERGIKIVMVNGRISPRSFKRYVKTRALWRYVLAWVDAMGMISSVDAARLRAIGVASSRISIVGNAKYDSLAARADTSLEEEIRKKLHVVCGSRVFVAGSTHDGEEKVVIGVYERLLEVYPDFILIVVPRHIERSGEVRTLLEERGFSDCITMSEINQRKGRHGARVILVDVIGELFKVYGLATVVFCGGSLVHRGGQNILEAAAWGKVIFYGPSMEDFMAEKHLLEEVGAGIEVTGEDNLTEEILSLLARPEALRRRGAAGRHVVNDNMGASRRYAEMIQKVISR